MLDELRGPISTGSETTRSFATASNRPSRRRLRNPLRRDEDSHHGLPAAFSASEVIAAAKSVWKYQRENRNLVGRGRAVVLSHRLIDRLISENQDALILLTMLKRHNWGRDFILSKPMAGMFCWTLPRWYRARDFLVRCGSSPASTRAEGDRTILPSMPGLTAFSGA